MPVRKESAGGKARAAAKPGKLGRLVKRRGVIAGNPAALGDAPTFDEAAWRKKWGDVVHVRGKAR